MSRPARVLVVDDDHDICRALLLALESDGHRVSVALSGAAALEQARLRRHDLVLLDLGLPDGDATHLVPVLRSLSDTLVVVSANTDVDAKVAALDAGADDYVTKPFSAREVLARVRARRRASSGGFSPNRLTLGDVEIDLVRREIQRGDDTATLRRKEWEILDALVAEEGRHVLTGDLLATIWDDAQVSPNGLYTHIRRIRETIEDDPSQPRYLVGERGLGYALRLS